MDQTAHPRLSKALLESARIFCKPFFWLAECSQRQRENSVSCVGHDVTMPRRLQPRERALTLPPSQLVDSQPHADLLTRLPLELRLQIWQGCLGGHALEITVREGKLVLESSRMIRPELSGPICGETDNSTAQYPWIPLLKTCRQIYAEAIDLLYSENAFYTAVPQSLFLIPQTLLPQRISSIRSLNIYLSVTAANGFYKHHLRKVWEALTRLDGLKTLHITLDTPFMWRRHWIPNQRFVLEPLKDLKSPKALRLTLPWNVDVPGAIGDDMSCDIDYEKLLRILET